MNKHQKMHISYNKNIVNKLDEHHPNYKENVKYFAVGFENAELSLEEFQEIIQQYGYTYSTQHKERRNEGNFIGSNVLSVDIDGNITLNELLNHQYTSSFGSCIYTTLNHDENGEHRLRLVFITETIITSNSKYRDAVNGLISIFKSDDQCEDPCRMFFGSQGCQFFRLNNILPDLEVEKLVLLGQQYIKESRQKKQNNTNNPSQVSANQSSTNLPLDTLIKTAKGESLELQNTPYGTAVHCPVHDDKHPSAFITESADKTSLGVHCSSCGCTYWANETQKEQVEAFKSFDYHLNSLTHLEERESEEMYEQYLHNEQVRNQNALQAEYKPIISRINHQYLPPIQESDGLTIIKSPKGSGKTKAIEALVESYKTQGRSVLVIGHRRALLQQLSKRLNLTCYLTPDGEPTVTPNNAYAICIDSMVKLLRPAIHKYDVIIIDEVEQVLAHLTSSGLKANRDTTVKLLVHYLCAASSLYCLDADIGDITLDCLINLGASSELPFINKSNVSITINEHPPQSKSINLFDSKNHLMGELLSTIKGGGWCYVTSNSKRLCNQINEAIINTLPNTKTILITADTSQQQNTKEFIGDVNTNILQYDVIITSPTLGTGIDINTPNSNVNVFGIFEHKPTTHFEIDQQLSRVRNPKSINVWVSPKTSRLEGINTIRQNTLKGNGCPTIGLDYNIDGTTTASNTDYYNIHSIATAMRNKSINHIKRHFIDIRRYNGCEVRTITEDSKLKGKGKELAALGRSKTKEKNIKNLLSATPISLDEYEALKSKRASSSITSDEQHQMTRYEIEAFYGNNISEDLIEFDLAEGREMIRSYEMIKQSESYWAKRDCNELGRLPADSTNYQQKYTLMKALLQSTNAMNGEGVFNSDTTFSNETLGRFSLLAKQHKKDIMHYWGVNIRKDVVKSPVQSLTSLLKLFGLKTSTHKKSPKTSRRYYISPQSILTMESHRTNRASR